MNSGESFRKGVREVAPALVGNVPFGIIVGVTTVGVGVDPLSTVAMSGFMFAGAAQLAMVDLLSRHAPVVIVVLTGLVVNLRYVMYSASISRYFADYSAGWKALLAAFLLDIDYAMSVNEYEENPAVSRRWYYLGVAIPLWLNWVAATAVGALLGAGVPESWHLGFAVPLVFMALLAPAVENPTTAIAAATGGIVAVGLVGLPFNLGLVAGAVAGVLGGAVAEERWF